MFDEYVEHASDPPALSPPTRSLPQLHYEGFEPSSHVGDGANAGHTVFDPATILGQPILEPTFTLNGVQYTPPAPIVSLTVASNILSMAFKSNTLQQLSLEDSRSISNITLAKKGEVNIYKIFSDPSGRHLVITTHQGENFYCYEGWTKARALPKCKMIIESVAWNPNQASTSAVHPKTATRELLLGARNGNIYETLLDAHDDIFKTPDRYVQLIYTLPDRQPVTGLKVEPLSGGKRVAILATSNSRIYQFVGSVDRRADEVGKLYESIFAPYKETAPKFLDLPGSTTHSELHVYAPPSSRTSHLMGWLTSQGIYHGTINLAPIASDVIDSASLLPYPYSGTSTSSSNAPLSIALTEFHFILLYQDRVCAVSNLDEKLVYEELLALRPGEKPIALAADPVSATYWIYTDSSLLEIKPNKEDQDVWRIYLEKGMHDLALQYAKAPQQRALVNASLADEHFKAGRYIQAAQCYAQSSRGFEEIALAFGDVGERDALRYFLICRLERLPKAALTQRMMLATWLVEFYLGKINTLDDIVASESASQDVENLRAERTMIEDELGQFFDTYKVNLHKETVYELILSHGRTEVFLHYATVVGDYGRVAEHHIMNEEWVKAIDVLNRQSDLELYYRFSPVLMRNAPKETVDSWLRQSRLDPRRLIPALLQAQHVPLSPLTPNHAIRYLQHIIFNNGSTSPTIHNLLLTLLASSSSGSSSPLMNGNKNLVSSPRSGATSPTLLGGSESDLPLLRFLSTAPTDAITSRPYYDLDYALRLCKRNNRLGACVHIYAQMGMWEESVELALQMGEVELAKVNADRPEDDEALRKKLWLMIARYVVQDKKDIKSAMRFLENTSVLKIEDILPFFPDFVIIDDFKDEICTALEGYSAHIDTLKTEMNDATRTAEAIKRDMTDLKNRFVTVEQSDTCAQCHYPLMTRQFYVFPCQHTFHADCLIGQVKEYLPSHALRRIISLQTELVKLTTLAGAAPHNLVVAPGDLNNTNVPPTTQAQKSSGRAANIANGNTTSQPQQQQRGLLSTNFAAANRMVVTVPAASAAAAVNVFAAAGAGLRDLIIPESLASAISIPVWVGGGANGVESKGGIKEKEREKRAAKLREELDDLLAARCPLCESVVVALDKPFVAIGEVDRSWDL